MKRKNQPRFSTNQKAEILALYEQSGLTQEQFTQQQGLGLSTLQRWLTELHNSRPKKLPGFVEVPNLLQGSASGRPYQLRFGSGVQLELARGFDLEEVGLLCELVKSL